MLNTSKLNPNGGHAIGKICHANNDANDDDDEDEDEDDRRKRSKRRMGISLKTRRLLIKSSRSKQLKMDYSLIKDFCLTLKLEFSFPFFLYPTFYSNLRLRRQEEEPSSIKVNRIVLHVQSNALPTFVYEIRSTSNASKSESEIHDFLSFDFDIIFYILHLTNEDGGSRRMRRMPMLLLRLFSASQRSTFEKEEKEGKTTMTTMPRGRLRRRKSRPASPSIDTTTDAIG
ncbi:hypothetical protein V1478_002478 [Vespula squamosa]|uniref:Uncharacterized protein n=1 Tax=Vespula squamosa TaxID=30214 RepID=A0ABD2BT57_VESSQ